MSFEVIPVSGQVTPDLLNRLQKNILKAFSDVDDEHPLGIQPIRSSAAVKSYQVQSTDRYIVVDARGGALRVSLPVASTQQPLTIFKSYPTSNAVTVVIGNGAAFGDKTTTITVADGASVRLLDDATNWWKL